MALVLFIIIIDLLIIACVIALAVTNDKTEGDW